MTTSITSVGLPIRVAIGIVDKAFLLKEILATSLPCLVNLSVIVLKGIVLDIDLSLSRRFDFLLLDHADKSQ